MFATIDWEAVKWGLFAIAFIVLAMTPVFWWLYDSDRVSRYWTAISPLIWVFLSIGRAVGHIARGEWWWAAAFVIISIVLILSSVRAFIRERGRIHADAAPS